MKKSLRALTGATAIAILVAACGGGGGDGGGFGGIIVPPATDTGRGSLVVNPPARSVELSAGTFNTLLNATSSGRSIAQVAGTPKCGIDVRAMEYRTVGGKGEATTATAALMVPTGSDAACIGARPVLLYAHGTNAARNFNMAGFIDPNQPAAVEAILVAAIFAAQGYIVVAPNYAGYDKSPLPYHPYLNGDQQGKDMVDALVAARKALPFIPVSESGAVFISGYSQGGYVALAAHREMQATGRAVTASAPLSAPSAISLLADYSFVGWPALGATVFTPLLSTSWQQQFGNIYNATSDIYEQKYATGIDTLLPSLTPVDQLFAAGKLPQFALYPANAVPGPINPSLSLFYGPDNLIKQSYLTQAANDIGVNPCPGNALPATNASLATTTPLDCKPTLGFRRAAAANDLRNWLPARPMLMCGGNLDPTVNFVSTLATAGYFRARGVPASALTVLDLEQSGGSGDPFAAARAGFATAKANTAAAAQGTPDEKALAVILAYHGTLLPPFCMVSARGFFQAVLGS
jgi:hypothetical protein